MVYKEKYLPCIEEWADNEWTLNFHLYYKFNIPIDLKMQTALCQEMTVPQILLKSIAVPDPSWICFWESTQLLFYSAGNSLRKTRMWWSDERSAPAGRVQALDSSVTQPSIVPAWHSAGSALCLTKKQSSRF